MIPRIRTLRPYVGLAAILGVAGALRCYRLGDAGQNLYYAAGVRSMLDSWHNFFYVAVEPGGTIMVDKPPLGLWLEAAAATLFGFHYWVLAVPQVVAGLVAVLVTFFVARSAYGVRVGLLAAAVLAVMPMSVVSARNNSFDTVTMLLTLLAASALLHGLSKQRLRWLAVSALLLGLGFNTKMSEAFLPLPAFAACYVLTCRAGRRQQILGAGLFCSILVVVSLSWVTAVGLTPAQSRPVVYNGRGNSIWALTFEYNGLNRIIGQRPQPHLRGDAAPAGISNPELNAAAHTPAPGPQRLLSGKLGTQIGWFLPLSLLGLVFAWRRRSATWHPREHDLLWGTWFVTGFLYFSVAAFALPQYLEAMAAPTAILAALGVSELPGLMCQRRNWTLSGIVGLAIYAGWLMAPAANSLAFAYAALAFAILALVAVALEPAAASSRGCSPCRWRHRRTLRHLRGAVRVVDCHGRFASYRLRDTVSSRRSAELQGLPRRARRRPTRQRKPTRSGSRLPREPLTAFARRIPRSHGAFPLRQCCTLCADHQPPSPHVRCLRRGWEPGGRDPLSACHGGKPALPRTASRRPVDRSRHEPWPLVPRDLHRHHYACPDPRRW
ncbi:MAG: glycosyltransferase family 39 protein [Dehalococcoidia bacterium]